MRLIYIMLLASLLCGCVSTSDKQLQYSRNNPQRGLVKQASSTLATSPNDPAMIRIIKDTHELELWRQGSRGWTRVKTYPICKFSGELGPKRKTGDRQAPEGFYTITQSSLNPFSKEYLSINTGFPNSRDRFHRYTGDALMIHGACSSIGCYAITDQHMEEVYAAVRDALQGGQKEVQLQIYPFRMNFWGMAGRSDHKDYLFWKELKQGWDWFETYQQPIPVTVVNGSYRIGS